MHVLIYIIFKKIALRGTTHVPRNQKGQVIRHMYAHIIRQGIVSYRKKTKEHFDSAILHTHIKFRNNNNNNNSKKSDSVTCTRHTLNPSQTRKVRNTPKHAYINISGRQQPTIIQYYTKHVQRSEYATGSIETPINDT